MTITTTLWSQASRHPSVEELLWPVLIQLGVIIVTARVFALMFRRLGQPGVVGEIAAGITLGPSIFGKISPELFQAVFHPQLSAGLASDLADATLGGFLTILSQLGLIFLLFLVGLDFDFSHLRRHGTAAVSISLAGVGIPFLLGILLAMPMHAHLERDVPTVGFMLFLGTAMAITAIPVLGQILTELNITRSRLGAVTIAAAATDDAIGWTLLASVAAVVRGSFEPRATLLMIGESVVFASFMIVLARPLLARWAQQTLSRGQGTIDVGGMTALLVLIFICAAITSYIGIFAVFGAFLLGTVLSGEHAFRDAVAGKLRDFVAAFFVPVFFTYTGLRTDIGSLASWQLWALCAAVLLTAIVGKLGGCGIAAWLGGFAPREAACIGAMMNTRGLMELVVVNLGKELGVIPDSVYCMLVIMALVTTCMTTPLLLRLIPGTELEPFVRESEFARKSASVKPHDPDPGP